MNRFWNNFSNAGVKPQQPHVLVRRIRLQNQVSLLFILFLLFFSAVNVLNNKPLVAAFDFGFAILLLIPVYLNRQGSYNFSSSVFFFELTSMVTVLCFILAPKRELEYLFLILAVVSLTGFRSKRINYGLFALSFSLFLAAKIYIYGKQDFPAYLNYALIFLITFSLVKYLKDEFEGTLKIIEKQNDQLKKLNEEKNKLISIASHDLRSPLIRIQSLLSLLSMEGTLSAEQKEILKTAQREAKNQTEMIKEILDLYAIDEGAKSVKVEPVDVPGLISSLIADFQPLASKKNISIRYESKTSVQHVLADHTYLKQIMENLFSNAIKFSFPNTTITASVQATGQTMQISIKDEGQGLDADDHKKLFKRFQRLSARPTGGEASSGLGLSIAKKYTEVMNGSLVCISEKGKGATFTVELPLALHVA